MEKSEMYALFITVAFDVSRGDLSPILASYGQSLDACPGCVQHVWLQDEDETAILHIFKDRASADKYLSSGMLAALTAHPASRGCTGIRGYNVLEGAGTRQRSDALAAV